MPLTKHIHITEDDVLIDGDSIQCVIDADIKITPASVGECNFHSVTITIPCEQITIDAEAMKSVTISSKQ